MQMDPALRTALIKFADAAQYGLPDLEGSLWNSAYYRTADPYEYGQQVVDDIGQYGHMQYDSPEFQQLMKDKGWEDPYARGVLSAGGRAMQAAGNENWVRDFQAGKTNLQDLYGDLDPRKMMPVGAWDVAPGLARSGMQVLGGLMPSNWGTGIFTDAVNDLSAANKARKGEFDPSRLKFDLNSPLARAAKAKGVQTYMGNKINDLSSWFGGGKFSKGFGGVLKWLFNLLTKIPGYERLVNWGANTFGKKSSTRPYMHYTVIKAANSNIEVLSPWSLR